ncbi:damage-inducible protein DinB [Roseibium polysiphoniae]|uniref:Damage-inducible protein DinB n=1 Tax=Roseibium polysiphoniae TaxID=2571221 RepID=A0A944GTZ3_9HYPH|nr:DinB family protein [Roseibium polysiphoniae]MBS8261051.1 damage-inducible protein DinB [Roseibium polysiphoniae]
MEAIEQLRLQARNNVWANQRLYDACCQLSQIEFDAGRSGFFPSIRETLQHILAVDRYYLDALKEEGRGLSLYDDLLPRTAAELQAMQGEVDAALITFCDALSPDDLTKSVDQDRGEKGVRRERIDRTLLHLFQHQIHHRGQAHAMLSRTSVAPPQLDEFFLEFDRHDAAQKLQ